MTEPGVLEKATLRRVSFRLLPFLMLAYLVCGFICNALMGSIYDATHSYPLAMLPIVAFALVGTAVLLLLGQPKRVTATA